MENKGEHGKEGRAWKRVESMEKSGGKGKGGKAWQNEEGTVKE